MIADACLVTCGDDKVRSGKNTAKFGTEHDYYPYHKVQISKSYLQNLGIWSLKTFHFPLQCLCLALNYELYERQKN